MQRGTQGTSALSRGPSSPCGSSSDLALRMWVPPVDALCALQQAFRTVSAAIRASCGAGAQRTDRGLEAAGPEGSASPSTRLAGVPGLVGVPPLCELGVLSGAGRRAAPRAAGSLSPGRVSGGMLSARGGLAAGPLMSVTHSQAP